MFHCFAIGWIFLETQQHLESSLGFQIDEVILPYFMKFCLGIFVLISKFVESRYLQIRSIS